MKPSDIKNIVFHASATRPGEHVNAEVIDGWHKDRGWDGIGYHFVIPEDGSLEMGRALDAVGAHTRGHNRASWGICLVGGLDVHGNPAMTYNDNQLRTARQVGTTLLLLAPQAEICGHRDLSPDVNGDGIIEKWEWVKDCPCFDVRNWWGSDPW